MIRRRPLIALAIAAALPLTACSTASSELDAAGATVADQAAPLTLDNCGTTVTISEPPARVITIKSTSTEMMLALGLDDRVIATAFQDGPVPERWAAAAADIPVLADKIPAQESVLALDPDFIYAGWESNVSADGGVGDRTALHDLGVSTYVSPAACREQPPGPLTFEAVFAEIEQIATIFGVPDRAEALVAEQQAELAAIDPVSDVSAFWWSSGENTPYAGAGIGAPQIIMDAAGLTNVLADVEATWTSAGWEDIVAADPDVLVLVDASWNSYDDKIAALQANPALASLTAVQEERFVRVPFAATEAGVRNVEAAASVAEQVHALGLGG